MIDITLPIPPSANAIWRGTGSRVVKSGPYKTWLQIAGYELQMAKVAGNVKPMIGSYMLLLALPRTMRGDIDNRHKAVNDLLQRMGMVANDKDCDCLLVVYDSELAKDRCRVIVGKKDEILKDVYAVTSVWLDEFPQPSQQEKSDV